MGTARGRGQRVVLPVEQLLVVPRLLSRAGLGGLVLSGRPAGGPGSSVSQPGDSSAASTSSMGRCRPGSVGREAARARTRSGPARRRGRRRRRPGVPCAGGSRRRPGPGWRGREYASSPVRDPGRDLSGRVVRSSSPRSASRPCSVGGVLIREFLDDFGSARQFPGRLGECGGMGRRVVEGGGVEHLLQGSGDEGCR
jgi:hypothetical protein